MNLKDTKLPVLRSLVHRDCYRTSQYNPQKTISDDCPRHYSQWFGKHLREASLKQCKLVSDCPMGGTPDYVAVSVYSGCRDAPCWLIFVTAMR